MPPAELSLVPLPAPADQSLPRHTWIHGWGGGGGVPVDMVAPAAPDQLAAAVAARAPGQRALARGMGRAYGDAAQLRDGLILHTARLRQFQLDPHTGLLTAQAGVTIGELLAATVPAGWMVPVVPGTQHVSVGGAIASDIHGKNHGTAGTFGSHVEQLELLTPDGEVLALTPGAPDRLFEATLGGLGLTGVIVSAQIRLTPVSSPLLSVDTDRVEDLDSALEVLSAPGGPHRVAWLDLLGSRPGRGVVTRADHLAAEAAPNVAGSAATVPARATVPAAWPGGVLRPSAVRAFNELRFRLHPRTQRGHVEGIGRHMFPLDALEAWPRLYGPAGLLQYQLVVTYGSESVLESVIERMRRAGVPCYLAVLKDFGPPNAAPLSFPISGWTLALDVPRAAAGLDELLVSLDELVAEAGGRVYLTKDARMRPEALEAMYPRIEEWRAHRERVDPGGVWQSDLALRTGLLGEAGSGSGSRSVAVAGEPSGRPVAESISPGQAPEPRREERRVLLLGGTSEIGLAILRRLAADGPVRPYLVGRSEEPLRRALDDLETDGLLAGEAAVLDALDVASHPEVVARAFARMGSFDVVVLAVGVLGGQGGLQSDRDELLEVMEVNFSGAGSLLVEAVRQLRDQPGPAPGTLIVLSSVAAERPRASNAVYGAAKAGLDALAQGLADATAGQGARVIVVRPGFVTTRMTAGLTPAPMATTPEAVAEAAVRALRGRAHTVWVPTRLRWVFAVLRHLPRPVFRRLPL